MRNLIIAAICGHLAYTCATASPPGTHEHAGPGSGTCAVWTSWGERKEDAYKTLRFTAVNWIQGYASGASYAFAAVGKMQVRLPQSMADADSVTAWMDRYCGAHPQKSFDSAAQQFISDIWENSKSAVFEGDDLARRHPGGDHPPRDPCGCLLRARRPPECAADVDSVAGV